VVTGSGETENGVVMRRNIYIGLTLLAGLVAGCSGHKESTRTEPSGRQLAEPTFTVRDTTITATFDAVGLAEPVQQATLSTKLMGSVTAVLVKEGDRVTPGTVLARIDARDLEAKGAQVDAGIAAADAVYQDALAQARRFRALYADSAATRYQLDQVEIGLARAQSGLRTAQASRAELDAVAAYAEVRAPFAGIVTRRHVDPGAFVAPGAPIVELQDASRLRISVSIPPAVGARLGRGQQVGAEIEGRLAVASIEGVVPSSAGGVYTVNALVDNAKGQFPSGGSATIRVPQGKRSALLVPAKAVVREGDLLGVRVRTGQGAELRWVRVGTEYRVLGTVDEAAEREHDAGGAPGAVLSSEAMIDVLSGLKAGDVILLSEK
jgi:RND family efflux transporter MFP subunit